jgi:hypothetical protein
LSLHNNKILIKNKPSVLIYSEVVPTYFVIATTDFTCGTDIFLVRFVTIDPFPLGVKCFSADDIRLPRIIFFVKCVKPKYNIHTILDLY